MKLLWRMVILSFFFGKFWQKRVLLWWAGGFAWVWPEGGIFQKYACFFLKVYVHFLFLVFMLARKCSFFLMSFFFFFTRVSFKKQQKKLFSHSMVNPYGFYIFQKLECLQVTFSGHIPFSKESQWKILSILSECFTPGLIIGRNWKKSKGYDRWLNLDYNTQIRLAGFSINFLWF